MNAVEPYKEFELDLLSIIQRVFSNSIQKPFTFQIIFDPDEIPNDQETELYIFEQLLIVFTEGLKVYFKKDCINISEISQYDFHNIQEYFKSMGFNINCQIETILNEDKINAYLENDELPPIQPNNDTFVSNDVHQSVSGKSKITTTGKNLKDYRFTMIEDNKRYIINFEYLMHTNDENCRI
jgi:hypothetical protein